MAFAAVQETAPLSSSSCAASGWTIELLQALDWKRFQELVTMLLNRAGFECAVSWVRPDAAVVMTVRRQSHTRQSEALVQCPGWAAARIGESDLRDLQHAVQEEGAVRGIFITPGEFTMEARKYAQQRNLELIDGNDLLRTLSRLSAEEHDYYLRMATVGQYEVPSCPTCGRKMELRNENTADLPAARRDLVFRENLFVRAEVQCRSITIHEQAEVLFMKGVNCAVMTVKGRATGNFVVQGKLTIADGAILSGLVAARSIRMDPGGVLDAEARILNEAEVQPVSPMPDASLWICPRAPRCRIKLPVRG